MQPVVSGGSKLSPAAPLAPSLLTSFYRRHVYADLQPYICTFQECNEPSKLFSSRSEWMQHEAGHHRQWFCNQCEATTTTFSTAADLETHFALSHPGKATAAQMPLLLEACERRALTSETSSCPLCYDWESHSATNHAKNLYHHLARHLQQLALDALPLTVDGLVHRMDHVDGRLEPGREESPEEDPPEYPPVHVSCSKSGHTYHWVELKCLDCHRSLASELFENDTFSQGMESRQLMVAQIQTSLEAISTDLRLTKLFFELGRPRESLIMQQSVIDHFEFIFFGFHSEADQLFLGPLHALLESVPYGQPETLRTRLTDARSAARSVNAFAEALRTRFTDAKSAARSANAFAEAPRYSSQQSLMEHRSAALQRCVLWKVVSLDECELVLVAPGPDGCPYLTYQAGEVSPLTTVACICEARQV